VDDVEVLHTSAAWSHEPRRPWDHPDWVLVRAVAAAVIDPDECTLIDATRLEEVPLREAAAGLGVSTAIAAAWRRNGAGFGRDVGDRTCLAAGRSAGVDRRESAEHYGGTDVLWSEHVCLAIHILCQGIRPQFSGL
jgi:hypothetical protein